MIQILYIYKKKMFSVQDFNFNVKTTLFFRIYVVLIMELNRAYRNRFTDDLLCI